MWQVYGETGTPVYCYWECKLVQPLWKTVWRVLKKLDTDLQFDLVIPFVCMYTKQLKEET